MGWEARRAGGPFRDAIASALSGGEPTDSEALTALSIYRWSERLRWSYQDIAATPVNLLALCAKFGWSRADLLATPAQALRDFQVIFNYEAELSNGG